VTPAAVLRHAAPPQRYARDKPPPLAMFGDWRFFSKVHGRAKWSGMLISVGTASGKGRAKSRPPFSYAAIQKLSFVRQPLQLKPT